MKNRLYDATKIDWDNLMFSTKELWMLLIPIMVEQMLNSLMGMADTMMVSNVGSVAMSAVSLVDSINTLDPGVCSTCHRSGDHMLPLSGKRG